jgi:hypothetical protein
MQVIEGRVVHKASNALQMTLTDGPGEPFAVGVQGAGDGRGKKLGILFGFKNGGTGNHRVTYQDGQVLNVASRDGQPSVFTDAGGVELATVQRGDSSTAVLPDGNELLRFTAHPDEARTPDVFRLVASTPAGEPLADVHVIRRVGGWTLGRLLNDLYEDSFWWDRAGQPLPVPILGTRVYLNREPSPVERSVLVGICVDIAIGLRPYIKEMN